MPLGPGARLGSYEILSAIGAGGMGEVYRARDTRLGRDVALKVVPDTFARDPDRLARFKREAQVLASLNDPHIAAIYGFEDSGETHALVLELVEGETLAGRIARGPVPLDEALPIARQIAEALTTAHEHGIIHRDLKPANIKVTPDGVVKVLDFGLAKPSDTAVAGGSAPNMSLSPTMTTPAMMTGMGVLLGTAAYMSPEQAKGRPADKRSDLWAFGCVFYEMLTGRRAFAGDDVTDALVAILSQAPDWAALPPNTPAAIRTLLRRCLEKDRRRRLDSAAAAQLEINDALTAPPADADRAILPPRASVWRRVLPWSIAAVALVIAGTLAWRAVSRVEPMPVYATLDAPADFVLGEDDFLAALPTRTPIVFTPDGRSLIIQAARAGKPQLFLRPLDRAEARPVAGTDDARVPFVSPDGRWVGFWAANELRKVPIEGGPVTTICALTAILGPYGAAWGAGDVIVFGDEDSRRIMRVSANGGTPAPVTTGPPPAAGRRHVAPVLLPDGMRVLFSDVSEQDANDSRLMVQPLDGGAARLVVASATDGRLLPSGQLAFMRRGALMTVAFDVTRAETSGDPVTAMSGVMQSGMRGRGGALFTGAGMFAVSSLGMLAVARGALVGSSASPLIWVTRDGRSSSAEPSSGAPVGGRLLTRVSPDRSRAIVSVQTPMRREMWFADWMRNVWTACGDCDSESSGSWSPDGQRLVLSRKDTLVVHALDGSTPDRVLVREADRLLAPQNWLPDGRIVYLSSPDMANAEIKVLEPGGSAGRVVVPFGMGSDAAVSPDGRWLAYAETQGGQPNVVVQAFPGPGSRTQVSAGGGRNPAWSPDGRTLYYLNPTRPDQPGSIVFAVDISTAGTITAGTPRELFRRADGQGCGPSRCYDLIDGPRFLFRDRAAARRESVTRMDLVTNWTATLAKSR